MKKLLMTAGALILGACNPIVAVEPVSNPIQTKERISCSYSCMDFTCSPIGMGLDGSIGNSNCGVKLTSCSGNQTALVERQTFKYTREKGQEFESTDKTIIERYGNCE